MFKTSRENYLRTIYALHEKLGNKDDGIKSSNIANYLEISKPSVSEMLKKLSKDNYINFKPYSNVFLTEKGLKESMRVMHNHRVIEVFLKKILKYKTEDVHEEAHKLEHAFSEESIKRLDNFLRNPSKCPHGEEIPHKQVK